MSNTPLADAKPDPIPDRNLERDPALTRVATYRREIGASLERIWENVLDWEHLPWLHSRSFAEITCQNAGDWGWRAEVLYPGGEVRSQIELLTDRPAGHYVTRVVTGPGSGGEIWTTLGRVDAHKTDIVVEFCMTLRPGADADALGEGYLGLYAMLWDEDETMMQQRQAELDRAASAESDNAQNTEPDAIELGTLAEVRSRLPLDVEAFGARLRILKIEGDWLVHSLTCPHSLGPLEDSDVVDGQVVCPWHGYRFDLRTGRSCDGRRLRLRCPARLEVDRDRDRVSLLRADADARTASNPNEESS